MKHIFGNKKCGKNRTLHLTYQLFTYCQPYFFILSNFVAKTLFRHRKYLTAILRHPEAVLELGAEGAVFGDGGPAIAEDLHPGLAGVDHGFDSEEHTFLQDEALAGFAEMNDGRWGVEDAAQAVAAEVADDGVAFGLDVTLDSMADVT